MNAAKELIKKYKPLPCSYIPNSMVKTDDLSKLIAALEVSLEGLKVSCGDRCAKGLNPCAAQDTLDQINQICSQGE